MNRCARRNLQCIVEKAGMTLLEMLVYCAALAIVVNVCAMTFVHTSRLSVVGAAAVDRMNAIDAIRREFNESVRDASAIVDEFQGYHSDNHGLVLRLAPRESGIDRYAIFTVVPEKKHLCHRILAVHNGNLELESATSYPIDIAAVDIAYNADPPSRSNTVSFHVQLAAGHGDNRVGTEGMFVASLRAPGADGGRP